MKLRQKPHVSGSLLVVGVLGTASAWAGGGPGPFELGVRASASVTGDSPGVQTGTTGPVTNSASDANGSAQASADYTALGAFGDYMPPTTFATATAAAIDQLTITAPQAPAGTTQLEMVWRLTGTLAGNGDVSFGSSFSLDPALSPFMSVGSGFSANTPGTVDEVVTFVYDNVPVGSPWNTNTLLRIGGANASGTADFLNSATFLGAALSVDGVRVPAGVTGLGGAVYAPTPNATVTLDKVLDTDTPIPGGGGATFAGVDETPSLSNGTVLAKMDLGPSTLEGFYTVTVGGTPVEVSREGGPMPDGNGVVQGYGTRSFDISGGNVLITPRRDASSARTIFATTGGSLQLVVEHGVTPVPDGSGNVFNNLGDSDPFPLSGENFAFEDTGTTNGIYARLGGTLQTVAQAGDASPDGGAYTGFDEPDIDGTNIVFEASTNAGPNGGIFGVVDGTAITVATINDTVPGQGDNFTFLDNPQISGPTVIFNANSASKGEGIYRVDVGPTVGSVVTVIEEGDPVPGLPGQTFSDIDDAGLSMGGNLIAYVADFAGNSESGVFAQFFGQAHTVLDSTQTLEGKEITDVNFDSEGVDGHQVAVEVVFDDGSQGIYLASFLTNLLGDYNNNGLVEQGDLNQVLNNWGAAFGAVTAAWTNQRPTEGIVDQAELNVVLNNWGDASAPDFRGISVPEPASALLGLGVVFLLGRRR